MQTFTFAATNAHSNAPLPGASVSVYVTGTTSLAALFDAAATPIPNPMTADSNGLAVFKVADGTYDIVAASGAYVSPARIQVQIYDLSAFSSEVATILTLGSNGVVGFLTVAAMNANLAFPAGTTAQVYADPTPANDATYLKTGASGSGAWVLASIWSVASLGTALTAEIAARAASEALLAPLANPAFTGLPTAPTQAATRSDGTLANTFFVARAVLAENTRATGVESGLQSGLASEVARATAAEAGISAAVDAERARADGALSGAVAAINQTIMRAVAEATAPLMAAITAATLRAKTSEAALATYVASGIASWLSSTIGLGAASGLPTTAPGTAGAFWNYSQTVRVVPGGSLPTSLPTTPGTFWTDGEELCVTPGGQMALPQFAPPTSNQYWYNEGVICIS